MAEFEITLFNKNNKVYDEVFAFENLNKKSQ